MNILQFAFYAAAIYYALFSQQILLILFLTIVALYLLASTSLNPALNLSTRKKIMQATWGEPNSPTLYIRVPVRTEKVEQIIAANSAGLKLTMTHFCIKACGQVLRAIPSLNGVLTLGKFVPKHSIDVGCLVNIEGGKDLSVICVKRVHKMSVEDIARFITSKAGKMKKEKGGQTHKKVTGRFKYIPTFIVGLLVQLMSFITLKLRISVPILNLSKNAMGSAGISSVGAFGFEDGIGTFPPFANWSFLLLVNAIHKAPVVEDGKLAVGRVMNCNFTIDQRYMDLGEPNELEEVFKRVFDEPQKYLNVGMMVNDS